MVSQLVPLPSLSYRNTHISYQHIEHNTNIAFAESKRNKKVK